VEFELALELGSDFADIFAVKAHDFALGDPERAPSLPELVTPSFEPDSNQFILADDSVCLTQVLLSEPGSVDGGTVRYTIALGPPVTCLQALLFGPGLRHHALRGLGELEAVEDGPDIDGEAGKIVHEVRHGKAAQAWFPRYYGTVDATPLYLILLSEVWRWTDDAALVRDLKEPAMRALAWIDEHGDLDGDGFVEYRRRSERGLVNQSWKDSDNSQLFHDGRVAGAPIAPCEVQGYVYDAKRRAAELAREVWRERELAERLESGAEQL